MYLAPGLMLLELLGACIIPEAPRDLRDQDLDGYAAWEDCDDLDPDVYPQALERCDGIDDDCDGEIDESGPDLVWYEDQDGDGWGTGDPIEGCTLPWGTSIQTGDCDDLDPEVSPDTPEVCDGVDDDCDGEIDEQPVDAVELWPDLDGDGYGNPELVVYACAGTPGLVDNPYDCQDADADIHPGGQEICDDLDQDEDCDFIVDDHDPSAIGQVPVYLDRDADGYGDSDAFVLACDPPEGYTTMAGDCDDTDASVGSLGPGYVDVDGDGYGDPGALALGCTGDPGFSPVAGDCDDADPSRSPAASEVFYDGLDQDCDGKSDYDADADGADSPLWGGDDCDDDDPLLCPTCLDTPYDGIDQDCAGDDDYDADHDGDDAVDYGGTDCDDTDPGISPAATILGYPGDWNCDGVDDLDTETWTDPSGTYDLSLASVGAGGDLNGDGLDDLLIGTPRSGASYAGAVLVLAGPADGGVEAPGAVVTGTGFYDLGFRVLGAGDLDGDGYDDLVCSAVRSDIGTTSSGAVVVLAGPLEGAHDTDEGHVVNGSAAGDALGTSLAVADLDGDGEAEILGGASGAESGSKSAQGAVYVVESDVLGFVESVDTASIWGEKASVQLGTSLVNLGDMDGDGLDDVASGGPGSTSMTGEVWLVSGPVGGELSVEDCGTVIAGVATGDQFGTALAGGADIDGDGLDDLLVGAPGYDLDAASDAGGVWVFLGPVDAASSAEDASASMQYGSYQAAMGSTVALVPDLAGDGEVQAVLGAPAMGDSLSKLGEVWVLPAPVAGSWGPSDVSAILRGSSSGDRFGYRVASVGDLDGDGLAELAVTAQTAAEVVLVRGGY